jgi:cellulose synthase/poly-beta-1,6-N-acetylglucosamine synthase-like glycosyltransferase
VPYTDPIVLGLLLLSLFGSLVYQWRRGLRGGRLAVVTFAMFYGLAVISALGMHCLDVLYGLTHGLKSFVTGKPFAWDWHTYSLLLFGVLMVWFGVQCVRRALQLGRGNANARIELLRLAGIMLLVVLPIIPIQPLFGLVGSGLSLIALLVVGLGGRRLAGRPSSEARAASAAA